jgi:hypothetical protein
VLDRVRAHVRNRGSFAIRVGDHWGQIASAGGFGEDDIQ